MEHKTSRLSEGRTTAIVDGDLLTSDVISQPTLKVQEEDEESDTTSLPVSPITLPPVSPTIPIPQSKDSQHKALRSDYF